MPKNEEPKKLTRQRRTAEMTPEQQADAKEFLEERKNGPNLLRQLNYLLGPIPVTLSEDTETLWEVAIHELNQSAASSAKAGLALLMLKAKSPHGEFLKQLEQRDIPQQTAYNAMSIAKLLLRLPESKLRTFAGLGGTKLIELARLPEDTLQEALEKESLDGTKLDELDQMSVRELKEKIRRMKDRHERELAVKARDIHSKDAMIATLEQRVEMTKELSAHLDDEELAAIQKLSRMQMEFDAVIGSLVAARIHKASDRIKVMATHLCHYMAIVGRLEEVRLRNAYPEIWEEEWASENELWMSQEEEKRAIAALPDFTKLLEEKFERDRLAKEQSKNS